MHGKATDFCEPSRLLIDFAALVQEDLGTRTTAPDEHVLELQYQVCREYVHRQAIMTRHPRDYWLGSYSGPPQ